MIPWLEPDTPFPPLESAMRHPNGLLAAGADLSPARLLQAYRLGIFPWYSPDQPPLWWSPDPRMVLFPEELKVSRSLAKRMRKKDYEIRSDTAFRAVMLACASTPRPDQDGTWIVPEILEGYCSLHQLGYAHSIETWVDGQLMGGLYGVAIGRMFYGESMFHHVTDASKLAFVHLVRHLQKRGYGMIDCQMHTAHLASFGAREIPRNEFAARLVEWVNLSSEPPGKWRIHDSAE
jgi:leucyl/phenylalanyl-tRNA--protein transferase